VNDPRIALEICLSSNVHIGAVESVQDHPFKKYFDKNLRVTLNTDCRLMSNTTLTDEYLLAADTFNLTFGDIRTLIINGFKSAFLPHNERLSMINTIDKELKSLIKEEKLSLV
jgi:adenosine deaminase